MGALELFAIIFFALLLEDMVWFLVAALHSDNEEVKEED